MDNQRISQNPKIYFESIFELFCCVLPIPQVAERMKISVRHRNNSVSMPGISHPIFLQPALQCIGTHNQTHKSSRPHPRLLTPTPFLSCLQRTTPTRQKVLSKNAPLKKRLPPSPHDASRETSAHNYDPTGVQLQTSQTHLEQLAVNCRRIESQHMGAHRPQ